MTTNYIFSWTSKLKNNYNLHKQAMGPFFKISTYKFIQNDHKWNIF